MGFGAVYDDAEFLSADRNLQIGIIDPMKPARVSLGTIVALSAAAFASPFVRAAWRFAFGAPLPWPLHALSARLPILFPVHMASAGAALLVVPLALACAKVPRAHRAVGRLAVLAIGLGGASALVVAPMSVATPAARLGFFTQGLVWLSLTGAGVVAIRRHRHRLHAKLMTAVAIVTFAPVLLRIALQAAVRQRWPFASTYAMLAWGSWLLPLLFYVAYSARGTRAMRGVVQLVSALQIARPAYERVTSSGKTRP